MKTIMDYETFISRLLTEVKKGLGEGYDTGLLFVPQINGKVHDGLHVKNGGVNMPPVVIINQYFEAYYRGYMDFDAVVKEILEKYRFDGDKTEDVADSELHFDDIKSRIVYRLINRSLNNEFLIGIPFFEYLDFAIIFYIVDVKNPYIETLVSRSHLIRWRVEKKELMLLAKENTPRLYCAQISTFWNILNELEERLDKMKPGTSYMNYIFDSPFYVLSNSSGRYGASCILYEGVVKFFAEQFEMDMVLLPSSVHEFLMLPYDSQSIDLYELKDLLDFLYTDFIQNENRLSDQVYLYQRQTDTLERIGYDSP